MYTLATRKMFENGHKRGRKQGLFGYFVIVGGFFATNTIIKVNNNKCKRTFDMIVREMP